MPKRQDDTDDDDIFDDRGLLKDKHSARVPMMMRGLTDLQRSVRDHYAPARVVDAFGDSGAGLHRPGSRYLRWCGNRRPCCSSDARPSTP